MTDTDCLHERVQVAITGLRSFTAEYEPDGILLLTQADLSNYYIAQVETICQFCGEQRILDDNEWEVA